MPTLNPLTLPFDEVTLLVLSELLRKPYRKPTTIVVYDNLVFAAGFMLLTLSPYKEIPRIFIVSVLKPFEYWISPIPKEL
jgi:hypothetical protein